MSNYPENCSTCKKSTFLANTKDCLCSIKGVVAGDYHCKKYDRDFIKLKPPRKKRSSDAERFCAEDFSID